MTRNKNTLLLSITCSSLALIPQNQATAAGSYPLHADPHFIRASTNADIAPDANIESQKFIEEMGKEAIGFLGDSSLGVEEKKQKFRALLNKNFDMAKMGRFCLGQYWNDLNPEQQKEYEGLFEDLIVSIYSRQFSNYKGQEFRVESAQAANDTDSTVKSVIIPSSGQGIPVDWRVRREDKGYRIVDVNVEGVSMAMTKKSEFASVIQREGGKPEVLLQHLREKKMPSETKT